MNQLEAKLNSIIDLEISTPYIMGISAIILQDGQVIFERHAGFADKGNNQPVTEKTIFRLASMTKPVVSAVVLRLIEENKLCLNTPINEILPYFTPKLVDGSTPIITIKHLLNHTSGLGYGFALLDNRAYLTEGVSDGVDDSVPSIIENLNRLARVPLLFAPGTNWCYSLSTDVLGAVIEAITGDTLPSVVAKYITRPLKMNSTGFYVSQIADAEELLSEPYIESDKRGIRLMEQHDRVLLPGGNHIHYAPNRVKNLAMYPSGGAGMIGSACDYVKFLEAIRCGEKNILANASVDLMTHDALIGSNIKTNIPGSGFGLGFSILNKPEDAASLQNVGTYSWGGVYGSRMFVDPTQNITAVFLTNTALNGWVTAYRLTQAIYRNL